MFGILCFLSLGGLLDKNIFINRLVIFFIRSIGIIFYLYGIICFYNLDYESEALPKFGLFFIVLFSIDYIGTIVGYLEGFYVIKKPLFLIEKINLIYIKWLNKGKRYEIDSSNERYFLFDNVKEINKEFDNINDLINFLENGKATEGEVYQAEETTSGKG